MPEPDSADRDRRSVRRGEWLWPVACLLVALGVFGFSLKSEPPFMDEWAYFSQAYYAGLLSQPDHSAWLDYPAYDLPPLPKYLVGLAQFSAGERSLGPSEARAWYRDPRTTFGPPGRLLAARIPSVILGAFGCLSIYALGLMSAGRRVGVLASLLLVANPLYRMHARRAMADVPAEAFILATEAVGLWLWVRLLEDRPRARAILAILLAGVLGGLAVEAKLNGGLALMVLAAWALMGLMLSRFPWRRRLTFTAAVMATGLIAFGTFVALNPFLTAHPKGRLAPETASIARMNLLERTLYLIRFRAEVSGNSARSGQFVEAINSPLEKLGAVTVQGFGRFGLLGRRRYDPERRIWWFDSRIRYDWQQDGGALLWLPWVLAGAVWKGSRGAKQYGEGHPPTAWAVLVQAIVTFVTVTSFIPLAWDRYYLSLQAPSCLLAASAAVAGWDALRDRLGIRRAGP